MNEIGTTMIEVNREANIIELFVRFIQFVVHDFLGNCFEPDFNNRAIGHANKILFIRVQGCACSSPQV